MAQLLPMSDEMMASCGRPSWIARHAIRADMRSGSRVRASTFQLVPGSSSSWSMLASVCSHAERVWWIAARRSSRPASPAPAESCSRSCRATFFASPQMPTVTFLVSPMRSGFSST